MDARNASSILFQHFSVFIVTGIFSSGPLLGLLSHVCLLFGLVLQKKICTSHSICSAWQGEDSSDDEEGETLEGMNDTDELEEEVGHSEDEDGVAPTLIPVKEVNGKMVPVKEGDADDEEDSILDLSKMSGEERAKLKQDISSTRIFTSADFEKMRRLVEREERAKRDPRAGARLKRLRAQGRDFEELSDDSGLDSDDDGRINIKGAVNLMDIAAEAKRKRANKIERLEKIVAGRDQFEHKQREGGSTNTEKTRKKHFLMSKFSHANREKQGSKETARRGTLKKMKKHVQMNTHESKKRRRRM